MSGSKEWDGRMLIRSSRRGRIDNVTRRGEEAWRLAYRLDIVLEVRDDKEVYSREAQPGLC